MFILLVRGYSVEFWTRDGVMRELEESARKECREDPVQRLRAQLRGEKSVSEDGVSGRSSHHDEVSLIRLHL